MNDELQQRLDRLTSDVRRWRWGALLFMIAWFFSGTACVVSSIDSRITLAARARQVDEAIQVARRAVLVGKKAVEAGRAAQRVAEEAVQRARRIEEKAQQEALAAVKAAPEGKNAKP